MNVAAVSPARLAAYALPGFPLAALMLPLYIYLPNHYALDLGLGLSAVGFALLAARGWDVVTDPLIGALSDRFGGRFGRRRVWMVLGTPLLVLSVWQLFVPGPSPSVAHLLVWTMLLYLGGTMVMLPYAAWGAELSAEYHERSRIAGAREAAVVAGTLAAAGLPLAFGTGTTAMLAALAIGVAVLLPLAVGLACACVPERPAPRRQPAAVDGWRAMRENPAFRILLGAWLLGGVANALPATLFLPFVAQVLGMPERAGLFLLVYFVAGIGAIPFWLRASRRFGKHRTWIAAMIWASAAFVWAPLLGAGDGAWFLVICIASGLALGADLVLPASMQADVVDWDRAATGRERAGAYFAAWGMATKLALALAVGIAFPLLDLAGFGDGERGLLPLALLYGFAPVLFKMAAILLMLRYPLDRGAQMRLRAGLADPSAGKAVA